MNLSAFRDANGLTTAQVEQARAVSACSALSEANRRRLVKGSKSPTPTKPAPCKRDLSVFEPIVEIDDLKPVFEAETKGPGRFTVIQYREWSDEYRIRTRVETSLLKMTPPEGSRYSDMLTVRGAKKITESCYYMAQCHGGFKTFVTGTFDNETRLKIASGKTTIQREVSRTMDSMQKMYQRGWVDTEGNRHSGHDKSLAYCWVVEIPKNESGEDNPHVHMMLAWRVKRKHFDDWAARIESLWGNGFFHLEKIRDPLCAGAYMAKAAGYMTKSAKQDDQGIVKGNRYGISKNARAPGWHTVTESELGIMGRLISEMHDRCTVKYGAIYAEKNRLAKALENTPRDNKHSRYAIGKKLQKTREQIASIPIVASKYQLILKGSKAFYYFMGRAVGAGWNAAKRPSSMWLSKFDAKLRLAREKRMKNLQRWSDSEWAQAIHDYSDYQFMESPNDSASDWADYATAAIH